ncbi:TRAP transporter small permease [Priestia abyssalis]|uniref:TRAP transporter small permease n=1 Tax=Priestia abyssalis TaxID=1221450 RepID=UPI000994B93D|nr:TRAP transporter small permease [Priestia abyssalis]
MVKILSFFDKIMNAMLALCLTGMSIIVLGNVILRYVFHSGLAWSEEVARFLFIWMVFLGAIGALKDNQHLGVDLLVEKLPLKVRKIVFAVSNVLVLYVLWLILDGSWKLTVSSIGSTAPATGLSLSIIYAVGIVTSLGMAILVLVNSYRLVFQKDLIEDLHNNEELEETSGSFHIKTHAAGEGK